MVFIRKSIIICFLTCFSFSAAQNLSATAVPDSLKTRSYKELAERFYELEEDSARAAIYALTYLYKAKKDRDSLRITRGYKRLAFISSYKVALKYADSVIFYAQNLRTDLYPAYSYMLKGYYLYQIGDYPQAFDYYLTANKYAVKQNNITQLLEVRQMMGALKNSWGDHREALQLYLKNLNFITAQKNYKDKYKDDFLLVLHNLHSAYKNNNKIDSSWIMANTGIAESLQLKDTVMYYEFVLSSGISQYHKKNYNAALDSINKAVYHIDGVELARAYVYKGKIYEALHETPRAFENYKKVDSMYAVSHDTTNGLGEIYSFFIDYYKEKGDIENQLVYIDKYLYVDSILDATRQYLNKNIYKKYDIPQLLLEKEAIIKKLSKQKGKTQMWLYALLPALLIITLLYFHNRKRKKELKRKFKALLAEKNTGTPVKQSKKDIKNIDIAEDKINRILKGLRKVEERKMYLNPNIKIGHIAKTLRTNTKYVSTVINYYEKKSFVHYINDLRIDYVVEKLKTERLFRRYSIKAISKEAGFNSRESFTKAFRKRTGMLPSYFIKELKNMN